jgi:hypothetical protein
MTGSAATSCTVRRERWPGGSATIAAWHASTGGAASSGCFREEARPFLEAALAGFERLGLPDGVGWCHDHLGWAAVVDGQYDRARDHFERAVEVARSDPLGEPHALAALGPLVALSGDQKRAL